MIIIMSDIHGDARRFEKNLSYIEREYKHIVDDSDTVLVAGDLLGNSSRKMTRCEKNRRDREFIRYVSNKPYDILSVNGNHDTTSRIYELGAQLDKAYESSVMRVSDNIMYLIGGEIYDIPKDSAVDEKVRFLAVNGGYGHIYRFRQHDPISEASYEKQYWDLLYRQEPLNVDYVISHDGPYSHLGLITQLLYGKNPTNVLCDELCGKLSFREWFFGHHHADFTNDVKFHCIYRHPLVIT